ncbi:hypothetical protein NMY22_g16153 [Coprinellus aureogranulatus]|nr:hypothetical protein NMY22_g16153 [Coprinellus aureogranulatus]
MTIQPQFTSFNPYQQQLEQQAAQAEYLRQQELFMLQQQQAQQQAQLAQQQEEWMRQQQLQQMQMQQAQQQSLFTPTPQLTVQPTGFGNNNPFAPASPAPSFSPTTSTPSNAPSFNLTGTYDNHTQSNLSSLSASPRPTSANSATNPYTQKPINVKTKTQLGETEAKLESLFANRDDGQDTFGNVGALRYGYTDAGRAVLAAQTGNKQHNPFAMQQQQQQQNNEKPFFDI